MLQYKNSIEKFNNDCEHEEILDEGIKAEYVKQLNKAARFEYSHQMYASQFDPYLRESVYKLLKQNLIDQAMYLIKRINEKSIEMQMDTIEIDLKNIQTILELSFLYCQENICRDIRDYVQNLQEAFYELTIDLSDSDGLMHCFESARGILVYETLMEDSSNSEFKFLMEVMFEQVKQKLNDKLNEYVESVDYPGAECKYRYFIII